MPAIASRGRGRRSMNEINMVPFIDVMLVLLIIFMVTAPMLTPGVINVPSVGKGTQPPPQHIRVVIDAEGALELQVQDSAGKKGDLIQDVDMPRLGSMARDLRSTLPEDTKVVIFADKSVQYDLVMQAMSQLQKAGIQGVALSVKQTGR